MPTEKLRARRSGDRIPVGRDFPPVQTGPGAHPASCTMGTGSFSGVKYGRGVTLTTHPLLVPWSWKSRVIPLPTLWATTGLVTGTFYFLLCPHDRVLYMHHQRCGHSGIRKNLSAPAVQLLFFSVPGRREFASRTELTFWRRNYFFLILAHSVYKMRIIQEPNKLDL